MSSQEKSVILESFWTLQSNLQMCSNNGELTKRILVTSASPQDGKSTVTSNLAVTLSHFGKNVLLVDSDLRNPSIHKIFNLNNDRGLTEFLTGDVKEINKVNFRVLMPNLTILTSGQRPSLSPKLIVSDEMKQFLKESSDLYDVILIDSPPVLAVTDTVLLSSSVDGVILVLDAGRTTQSDAKKTKKYLEKTGVKILGTILNKFEAKPGYGYYYPYVYDYVK